jgi:uncharacterized surface protein with fasciclin (FAS1) repeats
LEPLAITIRPSSILRLILNKAEVTSTGIVADNGVIHVIDTIVMPKYPAQQINPRR